MFKIVEKLGFAKNQAKMQKNILQNLRNGDIVIA